MRDGDYPAFGALDGGGAYQALFDTLDSNDDGGVDDDDQRSLVHVVGFSWGGIGAAYLAGALLDDDRIATRRAGTSTSWSGPPVTARCQSAPPPPPS